MQDPAMAAFFEGLMLEEIAPAIPYNLPAGDADRFGRQVLDRFRNPSVEHKWLSITVQFSSKMRMRNIPVLLEHYRKGGAISAHFALGFAAFLAFYRQPVYPVQDDHAAYFYEKWATYSADTLPAAILGDAEFWGKNLAVLPGFAEQVTLFLKEILEKGASPVLQKFATATEIEAQP